jgi:hypothetical protein
MNVPKAHTVDNSWPILTNMSDTSKADASGDQPVIMQHLGTITVLISAVGYSIGYTSVWLYALGLGVSPDDLALSQSDYLLLAGVWALLLGACAWTTAVAARSATTGMWFFGLYGFQGLALIVMFTPMSPGLGVSAIAIVLTIGALLVYRDWRRPERFRTPAWWLVVLNAGLLILLVGLAGWICWWWGNFVGNNPDKTAAAGPIALYFVLPPTEGLVTISDGNEHCVLRLSDRVLVTESQILVSPESVVFRPTSCFGR